MRIRETKYVSARHALAVIKWAGGLYEAYSQGKLLPKDMPDEESRGLAELVEMWYSMGDDRGHKLTDHLEEEAKHEPDVEV